MTSDAGLLARLRAMRAGSAVKVVAELDDLCLEAADRIDSLNALLSNVQGITDQAEKQARAQVFREAAEWHKMQHDSWRASAEKLTGDTGYRAIALERAEQHRIAERHFRALAEQAEEGNHDQ